jgi:hypothetical protein
VTIVSASNITKQKDALRKATRQELPVHKMKAWAQARAQIRSQDHLWHYMETSYLQNRLKFQPH